MRMNAAGRCLHARRLTVLFLEWKGGDVGAVLCQGFGGRAARRSEEEEADPSIFDVI